MASHLLIRSNDPTDRTTPYVLAFMRSPPLLLIVMYLILLFSILEPEQPGSSGM